MDLTVASLVATSISFVVFIFFAVWHVGPWMNRRPLAVALSVPLWIHAFRYVALQDFSAQRFGFHIPDSLARQIAWGDVAGAVLALAALWLLRSRSRVALVVIWLFVVETLVDFINASVISIRERTSETAHALTWVILNLYVPLLVVSLALLVWQLVSRRGEDPTDMRAGLGRPDRSVTPLPRLGRRPAPMAKWGLIGRLRTASEMGESRRFVIHHH
jgi:hypothetical protein